MSRCSVGQAKSGVPMKTTRSPAINHPPVTARASDGIFSGRYPFSAGTGDPRTGSRQGDRSHAGKR
jgi:hypothetical protein